MTSATQGRTGRPRVQTLDNVLAQAIAVVEEHGAAGLTMGLLAKRLGIGTMTLYGYVPSRERLVDLVVARLLTELPPKPALLPASWIDGLVEYMSALRAWAVERPALVHLNKERPRLTVQLAGHVQSELDVLTQIGFALHDAVVVRHALAAHLHGQLEFEMSPRQAEPPAGELAELTGTLAEAVDHLRSTDMADVYAAGVRALLVGFAPRLRRP